MKHTGIIRRIDELGRIVIPKEIRKRLGIDNGDLVDIFAYEEQIVLTKFHPLNEVINYINLFTKALRDLYQVDYLIVDKEEVVASNITEVIGKKISNDFFAKIKDFVGVEVKLSMLNLKIMDLAYDIYALPIIKDSDFFGYAIVIDKMISKSHKDFCLLLANYIKELL